MTKKWLAALLTGSMILGCVTGCGNSTNNATVSGDTANAGQASAAGESSGSTQAAAGKDAIRIVNGKIEIDEALKAYAKLYQEKTGQEVVIESMGGGVDINGALKGYLASGNMPDIFVFGGEGDYQTWKDHMVDLEGEKWAADTDFGFKDENGKTVGFPYAVEGYGITYNKDILDKADIDPKTLTNAAAYKEAFETIDRMKEELGLVAVCSVAAESGQMYWSTGNHIFGWYLSAGLDRNDHSLINQLKAGELAEERLGEFAAFFELLCQYSDPNTLISGTYDDQLAQWAQGKTAFITQGNWIDPSLSTYGVTFDCGIAPLAFMSQDTIGVLADCPSWWAVYREGKNIDGAKAFLNELALSEDGQKCLVTECGAISPYKSCTIEPELPLARCLKGFVDAGNTYSWQWTKMPEGIAMNATGLVFSLYAKGEISKEQFVTMFKTAVADYVAQ